MPKTKFSLNYPDTPDLLNIVRQTDHQILGRWALACAQRVLPYFEKEFPDDPRPRLALDTLKQWIKSGVFKMSVIRQAALGAHAAARAARPESMARSAARAAGQAVATAHVKTHSLAAANYVLQTIFYAKYHHDVDKWISKERAWQINKLESLRQ